MIWMKALAILVAVSVLASPVPAFANLTAASTPAQDYAAREAQAADLEGFTGGWHGVVITLVVVALLVWLFIEVIEPEIHHHHGHPRGPVHP